MTTPRTDDFSKKEAHDVTSTDEITGEGSGSSAQTNETTHVSKKRPNAFTELMSSRPRKYKSVTTPKAKSTNTLGQAVEAFKSSDPRNGLGVYIERPETNPEGRIVEYDDEFVVIRDKFPKASVHLLLLPRDPIYYVQHPLHLFSNSPSFLASVLPRIANLKRLAAAELRRQYGQFSTTDRPYHTALEAVMDADQPPDTSEALDALLPEGRDWLTDIVAGVHTHPSMNHLHIHVFSRDMHSPWLKHKKHYLSFKSSFLVQMDEFPLEQGSPRYHPGSWPSWDMKCWRCGRNFGNKFKALKEHLNEEFMEWKLE
ncbi:aprataxin-like protein [Coniothyrium glycines]